jgi:hypothetical protein
MYIFMSKRGGKTDRKKTKRFRAKQAAKNRRRVNRMANRPLGRRIPKKKRK